MEKHREQGSAKKADVKQMRKITLGRSTGTEEGNRTEGAQVSRK